MIMVMKQSLVFGAFFLCYITLSDAGFHCHFRSDSGYYRNTYCPDHYDKCCDGKGCCMYSDFYGYNLIGLVVGLVLTTVVLVAIGVAMCCFFCEGWYWYNRRSTPGRVISHRPGVLYYPQAQGQVPAQPVAYGQAQGYGQPNPNYPTKY